MVVDKVEKAVQAGTKFGMNKNKMVEIVQTAQNMDQGTFNRTSRVLLAGRVKSLR